MSRQHCMYYPLKQFKVLHMPIIFKLQNRFCIFTLFSWLKYKGVILIIITILPVSARKHFPVRLEPVSICICQFISSILKPKWWIDITKLKPSKIRRLMLKNGNIWWHCKLTLVVTVTVLQCVTSDGIPYNVRWQPESSCTPS